MCFFGCGFSDKPHSFWIFEYLRRVDEPCEGPLGGRIAAESSKVERKASAFCTKSVADNGGMGH